MFPTGSRSGLLKVAPEHTDPRVLNMMRKPTDNSFEEFTEEFKKESKKAGKQQYLVPYFISSHPGGDLDFMIHQAMLLKQNGYKPDQVGDFIPATMDVASAMYYTGIDLFTRKPVYIAKHLRDRKLRNQRYSNDTAGQASSGTRQVSLARPLSRNLCR